MAGSTGRSASTAFGVSRSCERAGSTQGAETLNSGAEPDRSPATDGKITPASRLYVPENSGAERCIVLLVFLVSFVYLCLFRRYTAMEPDEGIILQGAQRILQGEVLYRDFFSFYTPGSYYLLAALFKVFGSSMPGGTHSAGVLWQHPFGSDLPAGAPGLLATGFAGDGRTGDAHLFAVSLSGAAQLGQYPVGLRGGLLRRTVDGGHKAQEACAKCHPERSEGSKCFPLNAWRDSSLRSE